MEKATKCALRAATMAVEASIERAACGEGEVYLLKAR